MGSRDEKEHMREEEASARAAAEIYSLRENEREDNEVDRGMQVRSRVVRLHEPHSFLQFYRPHKEPR
jgi:hypothetical protein